MFAVRTDVEVRESLLARLADARVQTDALFDVVRPDSLYERPIAERHRIVFYLGHLEAFDWNLLRERFLNRKTFQPEFDRLFAFGIDPVDRGLPADQPSDWPSLAAVHRYVSRVRTSLDNGLATAFSFGAELNKDRRDFPASVLLNAAIEHRLMHAETLAYMIHRLPLERKRREPGTPALVARRVVPAMLEIPAGSITLGLSRGDRTAFGWDNEYEAHHVTVPAFAIDKYKVSNGQYLEFVAAGGYENRAFWSERDWNWRAENGIRYPAFWKRIGKRWYFRAMFEELPLPLTWPAYVSHAEASAFARWAGKLLPTEAQWQRAAYGTPQCSERMYLWGTEAPGRMHGNFDFHSWDPAPLSAFPEHRSAFGVAGMLGNGWEWTSSVFEPFSGFEPFAFYPGYSANFFDGQHYVAKGGSARTAACLLRRSFRNWFQPHYPYVYAGFRCVNQ
jgi:ergothioneine biosynthesis protein EgtB